MLGMVGHRSLSLLLVLYFVSLNSESEKKKKILSMLNNKDEYQVLERRIVYANMSARRRRKICSNTRP